MNFDQAAPTYDAEFTNTPIGRLQRNMVLGYMDALLNKSPDVKILELNAGTGEDAIHFAARGHPVTATDISASMIAQAKAKAAEFGLLNQVLPVTCDMRNITTIGLQMEYDIVFSNFGGLNCLSPSEVEKLGDDLLFLLKPGGRFIAVVMPRFCLWETLYFLMKGQKHKMFRRNSKESILVPVKGAMIKTWYYSPGRFIKLLQKNFRPVKVKPVGFLIPPSYLGPAFTRKSDLLKALAKGDRMLGKISFLAGYSDHFLIDLTRIN